MNILAKRLLTMLLFAFCLSAHADLLKKEDIPKLLLPFYKEYILAFHSHSSSPEVYKAKCFEDRYPDCIIVWAEILPSNSDVHISIVAPNVVESRITIPTGDNEFILGVEPVDEVLLLSLIDTHFDECEVNTLCRYIKYTVMK